METALLIAAGYVLGSMPWGYWLPRLVKHDDIRRHGDGTGDTQALLLPARQRHAGLLELVLDLVPQRRPAK